jgi:stage II sporulation protein D
MYRGLTAASERCNEAVDATRGELLRYQGELCETYYFSSDGGATENCRHVFGYDRPYLCGKLDPFEQAVDVSNNSWEIYRSSTELQSWLAGKGYEIGPVTEVEASYSDFGNVIALQCADAEGVSVTLDGRISYTGLGLDSCRFTVSGDGRGYRFTGRGWGHNCGMSQWGAYAMAQKYGYSYEDILEFYFTGATIG